jgi:hypothetical protein
MVTIETENNFQFQIFNLDGNLILEKDWKDHMKMNTSDLPNGFIFLIIET